TWAHRTWVEPDKFFEQLQDLPGVDIQPLYQQGAAITDHATAACIFCKQGAYQLSLRQPTVVHRSLTLQAVVAPYNRYIERHKLPLVPAPQVVAQYVVPGVHDTLHAVLLTFGPLPTEEFLALVALGVPTPPGVTRFVLPEGRAMGLNVPLALLGPGMGISRADAWLDT